MNAESNSVSVSTPDIQGQAPNTDAPSIAGTEDIKAAVPERDDLEFSRRFAALARKEREIQEKTERNKSQFSEVEKWKESQSLIKSNPVAFLEQNGWKFQDIVEFVLNDQKPTANKEYEELRAELNKMKEEKEQEKTQAQRNIEAKNIAEYKSRQRTQLEEKKDVYELINQYDQFDLVYESMNEHFQKTGEELSLDKVAQEVEKYLEDQFESQFKTAASTSKFKSRFNVPTQETPLGTSAQGNEKPTPEKITEPTSSRESSYIMDEEESKKRSAKILADAWKKKREQQS